MSFTNLQKSLNLKQDGIVGRGTLSALFSKLGATQVRADELALSANIHLRTYGILDNEFRLMHFVAQVVHESGSFKYMEEIASGTAYEGRADLGNTQTGDGTRYKGRGPIQLTGRANYRKYGQALGLDFENNPTMVALPSVGMLVACKFWSDKGLNELADKNDVVAITKLINGGTNGLDDRKAQLDKIKSWF